MKCWNCGKTGCRVSKCPQPLDQDRIRANKKAQLTWLTAIREDDALMNSVQPRVLAQISEMAEDTTKGVLARMSEDGEDKEAATALLPDLMEDFRTGDH